MTKCVATAVTRMSRTSGRSRDTVWKRGPGAAPAALEEVLVLIRRHFGHEARFSHFPIVGRCAECARLTPAASPRLSSRAPVAVLGRVGMGVDVVAMAVLLLPG